MFDFRKLSLEALIAPSLKLKEIDENEYKKLQVLREAIIESWVSKKERYIMWKGKKYKVIEVKH